MSLLGVAVGKEKFLPDAREALMAMMTTTFDADDIQREYVSEAMVRIVQCLGESFVEFCQPIVQKVVGQDLILQDEVGTGTKTSEDDEDDLVNVKQADGKTV